MRKRSTATPQLVRPSQLARFWEVNHETVTGWIHSGRLVAIRSPGNHFRLRIADVRAFCEREGLVIPPFVAPPLKRVVVGPATEALRRALTRSLKAAVILDAFDDGYQALIAAASAPTALVALGRGGARFDLPAAIRALRASPVADASVIVAFDATSRAHAAANEAAGANRSLGRTAPADLPRVIRELLGLGPE